MALEKLVVELTSMCNLKCRYCFQERGNDHLDIGLLQQTLQQARIWGATKVTFTGGEPSLYPWLDEALHFAEETGYRYAFVTNGWHFERVLPMLSATAKALNHIFFSIDSASELHHDEIRGTGSYQRIRNAAELCRNYGLPFSLLAVISRKNIAEIDRMALLAEQIGASGIRFGHLLPASEDVQKGLALTGWERAIAEDTIRKLGDAAPIKISFSASARNEEPGACCETFAGETLSVDSRGRVSFCCQLADYRGATIYDDIVSDLKTADFTNAYGQFLLRSFAQRKRRDAALAEGDPLAKHPCDFCVTSMKGAQ